MEYHEPDGRWPVFGAKSFEEFKDIYVIKGKFHSYVPQDIKDAYSTVEFLMAHSYYHWQMYDEAFSKLLRTIEMAVKYKCRELGIEFNEKSKLIKLIEQISQFTKIPKFEERLNQVRIIRNELMHPKNNSFIGGILKNSMIDLVTIINEIFIPSEFVNECKIEKERIDLLISSFRTGTFVLELNNLRYLIYSVKCFEVLKIKENWIYYIVCYPVIENIDKEIEISQFSGTKNLIIKNLEITNTNLKGQLTNDEQKITISKNETSINTSRVNKYISDLSKYSEENILYYGTVIENEIDKYISKFLYENYQKI